MKLHVSNQTKSNKGGFCDLHRILGCIKQDQFTSYDNTFSTSQMSGSTRKRGKVKMAANSDRENFADGTDERSRLIRTSGGDDELIERPRGRYHILGLFIKIVVALICGFLFGVALEKGRVFEPKTIRDQMVFKSFIMLKMFLAATATGQLVFCILSVIPKTKEYFQAAVKAYVGCFSDKGIITSGLGTFILGIGMTLAGACPGMVLVQVGTWTPNGIFTLLGCLIGALSYGMVAPYIVRVTKPKQCFEKHTVFQKFNLPFIAFGLPMAVCLGVVVFLLEYFWDWEKDLRSLHRDLPPYNNIATAVAWRPFVSGMLIGVLQLPLVFALKDTLGSSSSYCTVVSQWVVTKRLQELFPYLASKRCGLDNWWQVIYVCGAILGGAISALASDTLSSAVGTRIHTAILGGLLMLWGARLAAGCTSGHGLSGMGLLAWLSFIAVPFMFAGGIVTAFAMQATGALDDYVKTTGS